MNCHSSSKTPAAGVLPCLLCVFCFLTSAGQVEAATFDSASSAYRDQNYEEAFEQFSTLAAAGDAQAQTVLAIMYKYGEGVPLDHAQAFHWYQQAAEQGYPPAQFNVGQMLLTGSGTTVDREKARQWIEKAASAGFSRAADLLAEIQGEAAARKQEEPLSWSQQWNLRLPNQIRENSSVSPDLDYQVYRVQLGAMQSPEGAQRLWQQISAKDRTFFLDFQPIYRPGVSAGRSVIRLQLGPFESKQSANQFCSEVLERTLSGGCLVLLTH